MSRAEFEAQNELHNKEIESQQKEIETLQRELKYWQNTTLEILKKHYFGNNGIGKVFSNRNLYIQQMESQTTALLKITPSSRMELNN